MKIKDLVNEEGTAGSSVSGAIATNVVPGTAGSIFAGVPLKRNQSMIRKRPKKESADLIGKKSKYNVIEDKK